MGRSPAKAVPRKNGATLPPQQPKQTRKKRVAPGETKRERFIRIGTYRMKMTLKHLRNLKPLSGVDYEWNEHDASVMIARLRQAVDEVAEAFVPRPATKQRQEETFSFSPERRH